MTASDALGGEGAYQVEYTENRDMTPEEAARRLADATGAEVVTVIGNKNCALPRVQNK